MSKNKNKKRRHGPRRPNRPQGAHAPAGPRPARAASGAPGPDGAAAPAGEGAAAAAPRKDGAAGRAPRRETAGSVARWARRFRRLAAVVALAPDRPIPGDRLDQLRDARHGGIGIPKLALQGAKPGTSARFEERPFLVLDHATDSIARLARASAPRVPPHLVDAAVHALAYAAPLVVVDRRDAAAIKPLVSHVVAIPGKSVTPVVYAEVESLLRGGSAAVQDGYGQIDRSGQAILELLAGGARERTLSGLLQRLVRARTGWAARDAERRFRRIVDAAQADAMDRGVAKGELDPLTVTQPVAVGYLDLLPLLVTRLGPGSDLVSAFRDPLALLGLGVGVVISIDN